MTEIEDLMQQQPIPDWVHDMIRHYQDTGLYRPQDIRRVLGDPIQGVDFPNGNVTQPT